MQILLSCAKTMAENNPAEIPRTTLPRYAREAAELALQLATLSTEELERCCAPTGRSPRPTAGVTGSSTAKRPSRAAGLHGRRIQAYRPGAIHPRGFRIRTAAPQHHVVPLRLLRPLDAIRRYRLEGDAVLPGHDDQTMFGYWQGRLTEAFLEKIHADDGILVNLASSEDEAPVRLENASAAKRVSSRPNSASARATV